MIDPQIALGVQPVQIQSPMDAYAKALSLKNMMQQGQLGQQQLQAATLENQQRQRQLNDQVALQKAWVDSAGDPNQLTTLSRQYGASPQAVMGLHSMLVDAQTKAAALDEKTRANALAKNTAIQSRLAPIVNETDPVKQKQLWDQTSQSLVNDGTISPQEAALHPYPGSSDGVKTYVSGLNLEKWSLAQQQTATANQRNAAAAGDAAKLPGELADADLKQRQNFATQLAAATDPASYATMLGEIPQKYAKLFPQQFDPKTTRAAVLQVGMTPDQVATTTQAATNAAETRRHNAVDESQGAQRNGIEAAKLAYQKSGGDFTSNPVFMQGVVNGEIQINPRDKNFAAISAAAKNLDSTWTSDRYLIRQQFTTSMTSGPLSRQLQSINQGLAHLAEFKNASDQVGVISNLTPGGSYINGNVKTMKNSGDLSGQELTTMFAGGKGALQEVDQTQNNLHGLTQGVRNAGVHQYAKLVAGRVRAIAKQYVATTGQPFPVDRYMDSGAVDFLRSEGVDPYKIATDESQTWMQSRKGSGGAPGGGPPAPAPAAGAPAPAAAPAAAGAAGVHSVPAVGSTFNGEKVLKVTRVQ